MSLRTAARRLLPYFIVAGAGFLIAYLIVFFFLFPSDVVPDAQVRVPAVTGIPYDEAVRRLGDVGLKASRGEANFHATAARNQVLNQVPPAGSMEPRGTRVVLDISSGQRQAQVPDVVGMAQQQAQVAIENAGFDLGDVAQQASDQPRGTVLASTPAAGSPLSLPAAVSILVSLGPSTVTTPDVVGRKLPQARAMLEQLGLRLGSVTIDSLSAEPPQTVIAQRPSPRQTIAPGTRVSLTVSGRAP
ncbi:MAG TPA: PASTA domain-containing protein [Gemmatimonadaceae bacterium]|nr:PASTA domain-containing protein [Gemmatimonadaceae bacterium]